MAESWTPKDDYSPSNHNHDTKYASSNHNHDSAYAAKSHNHDTVYSKLGHGHDYAASNHNHDSVYSKLGHNHDDRYYTEAEVDAMLKALKDEVLVAGIDMLPVGTIMWFKQSVTLSNKWQVYEPLIGRYPLGATSGLGSTVEAGLPNIEGTFYSSHGQGMVGKETGPFKGKDAGSYGFDSGGNQEHGITVTFDASRSNAVYGNSDTVTPPSAKLIPYVKIA